MNICRLKWKINICLITYDDLKYKKEIQYDK